MAALDFPAAPTNGQVYGKWTYDGTVWKITPTAAGGGITQADADIRYVNVPGDTMTGALVVGTGGSSLSKSGSGALRVDGAVEGVVEIYHSGKRPYYAWYGGTDNARRGYLGYANTTTNQSTLTAEGAGGLVIAGSAMVVNSSGTFDLIATTNLIYHNAVGHAFRNVNGSSHWATIDDAGGTGGIRFAAGGGGIYMNDTTWVRVYGNKNFFVEQAIGCNGYLSVGNNGGQALLGSNWKVSINALASGLPGIALYGYAHFQRPNNTTGSGADWGNRTLVLSSQSGGANDNCGIGLWAGTTAPIIGGASAGGEKVQILNQANSGYVPIWASAFTVTSSEQVKENVAYLDDDLLLSQAKQVSGVRFRWKVRPLALVPSPEFLARQATARDAGQTLPVMGQHDTISIDHDCALVDACPGTTENPCAAVLNDTDAIGLLAEELADIFPEAVMVDETLTPAGIDIAQVAATALASVGALLRKIDTLEARLVALEAA